MINFETFTLANGLRVYHIEDHSTPIAALNIMYNVGSKDEEYTKTGFAHLFEHLMFGGSANIPSYDAPVQMVGGENNAFTSADITNYYITLPAANLETAFWLESDRMQDLDFSQKSLDVQKKVVVEEFNQRYLNQPYGDLMLKLKPLAYKEHPYMWQTIGREVSHIEDATLDYVKSFFYGHYAPNNAVMCVAGAVSLEKVKELAEKWFGPIEPRAIKPRNLPQEPLQTAPRFEEISSNVPADMITRAYHMPGRFDADYLAADLLSDILGRSKSSVLHQKLVKEQELFSSIGAYVLGSFDPGLLLIQGRVNPHIDIKRADEAIQQTIDELFAKPLPSLIVEKVKIQAEASLEFSQIELLNQALNLCYYALVGKEHLLNEELSSIQAISVADIEKAAASILKPSNCSTLYYKKNRAA